MINKVKFKVKGNSAYPVNMLSKRGIRLSKIRFTDDGVSFVVDAKDYDNCREYLEEFNRKYAVLSEKGIVYYWRKLKKRAGLIVGAAIFLVVAFLYSLTILTINISGNSLVPTEVIRSKVCETVNPPLFNAKIDRKRLEKCILSIDGISSVSVEKRGTAINIKVLEELPILDIEDIKKGFQPITSKYDSVVTRVIVTGGTPLVKSGQAVKKGQQLIAPYLMAGENNTVMCKAGGEVYGKVWLTKSKVYGNTKLKFKRTGNKSVYIDLKPFNWIKKKKEPPFAHYQTKKEIIYIGDIIPLKAVKYTYYETKPVYVEYDCYADIDLLIKELSHQLEEEIPEGATRERKWYDIKKLDKGVNLVIYYEIETLIS
jgi:similar to stage IV sporulation protein